MSSKRNTLWLIKSAGQVIGPYSDYQVVDLLRSRTVVPLDEVSAPCDRWGCIRDTPKFASIVEELRLKNLRGVPDDTITQGDELTSVTETMNTSEPDDLTSEVTQPRVHTVQDILFHSVEDHVTPKSRVAENVFTHEGDRHVQHQVEASSKWIWAFTAIVIFLTLSFVVFKQFIAKPIKDRTLLEESITAGIDALELGDYNKALENFKRVNEIDPQDSSIYLYLGMLTVQVEGQGFQGRKILEKLLGSEGQDIKRVLTGIGLAQLKEGDYKGSERSFNKALDLDPLFQPALINLGAAAYYQDDWARANNNLQLAVKEGSQDGAEIIILSQTLIKLWEKEKEARYLQEAAAYLDQFSQKSHNYGLEAYIGSIYVSYLLGEKQNIYSAIDKALDMDILETESHRQNLFIHRSISNWSLISQWCLKLTRDLDPNARIIAFEAMCLMKSNDLAEASRKIDDALAQSPKDPLVLSVYAIMQGELNSSERAIVAIDKALANDPQLRYAQPRLLKGRYCRQWDDVPCQIKYWTEALKINPTSLSAIAGLAQININSNNIADAKMYLMRGLNISKEYRPLFSINRMISRAEDRSKARGL